MAAGCVRTTVATPLNTGYVSSSVTAELKFLEDISARSVVSNDEGLHGLFALADGGDPNHDYVGRVIEAKHRRWLTDDFDEPGDLAMQRGTLARGVAVLCGVKGGVMMRLLGPDARYATRELVYQDIMPQGTEQQTLSGPELVGVLSKAQDRLRLKSGEAGRRR